MIALKQRNRDLSRVKPAFAYQSGRQIVGSTLRDFQLSLPATVMPGYAKGYLNPDWRNKVQQKKDATTPYELRIDDYKYMNVHDTYQYTYQYPGLPTERYTLCAIPPQSPSDLPSVIDPAWGSVKEARNIALAYRTKYIADVTQPFQSQVFLGEIKETLDFIRHPFEKLKYLASSASVARYNKAIQRYRDAAVRKRGGVFSRTNEAKLLLADVADAWFEVRFGMLPLVQDITSAVSLASGGRISTKRSSFRGDAKQAITPSIARWDYSRSFFGNKITTGEIRAKYFINTGIVFDDTTNYAGFAEYLQNSTLELTNFIPTVWELTPGSWLVDYFVNVGDFLNTAATSSKVTMQYDCRSTVVDYELRVGWEPITPYDSRIKVTKSGPLAYGAYTRRFFTRETSSDVFPSVNFSLPTGMTELANTALYLSRKISKIF